MRKNTDQKKSEYDTFHAVLFVGNKAKERISKRVLHKNKATLKFPKNQDFFRGYKCVYHWVRNLGFSEILMLLCFYVTPVLRFALLPHYRRILGKSSIISV